MNGVSGGAMDAVMTEDEVIDLLCKWLVDSGWKIVVKNMGHSRGIDILAHKGIEVLIVEAKGGRGNPKSHVTTRTKFDSGQIKTHFGKAIVKVFEEKNKNPKAIVAIAHPEDKRIRDSLSYAIPEVIKAGIKLYWVSSNGKVREQ